MLEIPQRLSELFNRLLYDYEYFEYAMVNGGLAGLICISLLVFIVRAAIKDSREQRKENGS